MADKIFVKPFGTGTWVDTGTYLLSFVFQDKGKAALNKITARFRNDIIQSDANPSYQSEIKWESGSYVAFAGRIEKPQSEYPETVVLAYSYGAELLDQFDNNVYENTTPEAIAKTVIESGGELTFDSTEVSGITIDKIVFRDKKKSQVLGILADLLGWVFGTNPDKTAIFESQGKTDSGVVLEVGDNVLGKPQWDYNPDWVVNNVIVEGGLQDFATTQTFKGPSNTFTISYEPSGNVKVLEGTTELIPTVEGSTETQDYTVDAENKRILTGSARSEVTIDYGYKIPIRIEQRATTDNLLKSLKVKNKSIKSYSEARETGREILSIRQNPTKKAILPIFEFDSRLKTGCLTQVVDAEEKDSAGKGINESMVISELTYNYPESVYLIKVGTNEYSLYDLLRDTDEKIRELQQEDTNTDIIQEYRLFKEKLTIGLSQTISQYTRDVNDSFILGTGTLGTTALGDRRDGDTFSSYDSGSYKTGSFWVGTGSYKVAENKLDMDTSAKVTYIGRDGSKSFQVSDGKINLKYEKNTSNNIKIYLREKDSDDSFIVDFAHSSDSIHLKLKDGGTESSFLSNSFAFTTSSTFTIKFNSNTFRVLSGTFDVISTTASSLVTGSFSIESVGGNSKIKEVEILTGV